MGKGKNLVSIKTINRRKKPVALMALSGFGAKKGHRRHGRSPSGRLKTLNHDGVLSLCCAIVKNAVSDMRKGCREARKFFRTKQLENFLNLFALDLDADYLRRKMRLKV